MERHSKTYRHVIERCLVIEYDLLNELCCFCCRVLALVEQTFVSSGCVYSLGLLTSGVSAKETADGQAVCVYASPVYLSSFLFV